LPVQRFEYSNRKQYLSGTTRYENVVVASEIARNGTKSVSVSNAVLTLKSVSDHKTSFVTIIFEQLRARYQYFSHLRKSDAAIWDVWADANGVILHQYMAKMAHN
jgi:hypothetical protein